MVIQAEPVIAAVRELEARRESTRTVLLSPRGRMLDQELVEELARSPRLLFLCGRYEGFDERVSEILEPEEISIGDYILGGGEVAAMVVMEAVARLVPGVVGDPESVVEDSFIAGLLDHPSYTRPPEIEGRDSRCPPIGPSPQDRSLASRTRGGNNGNPPPGFDN